MQFSALQPPRRLLFGPGPTMVEPSVYQALAKPLVGHLDPYFIGVLDQVREMLRSVFGTRNPLTWAISGTGSSGMETAIANFVEPGSKFAVLGCGFFGSRMAEMGRRQGAQVLSLEKPWGDVFGYDEVAEFVQREKPGWWRSYTPRRRPGHCRILGRSPKPRVNWTR